MINYCFKETHDDWYGNYKIGDDARYKDRKFVHVYLLKYPFPSDDGKDYKVGVWGNDDFGLEKEYENRKNAQKDYDIIMSWSIVDKSRLKSMGFEKG